MQNRELEDALAGARQIVTATVTVRSREGTTGSPQMQKSPPFDGLSANRGGEIRCRRSDLCRRQSTRNLLLSSHRRDPEQAKPANYPIRVAVHALTCIHLHSRAFRRFHLRTVALIPPHFVTATVTVRDVRWCAPTLVGVGRRGGARPALDCHGECGLSGSPTVGTARCPAGFTLREHGVGRAIRGPHVDP